jgi:hypothetical protein
MQEKTRKLEENARIVGLKINAKKTKLIYLVMETGEFVDVFISHSPAL